MEMDNENEDSPTEEELPDIDDVPIIYPIRSDAGATNSPNPDLSQPSTSRGPPSGGKKLPTTPTLPAVKDSDGFLAPPPPSLLIRRTRTSSTSGPTYVVSSTSPDADNNSPPLKRRFSSGDLVSGEEDGSSNLDMDSEPFEAASNGGKLGAYTEAGLRMNSFSSISKLKRRGRKSMMERVGRIKEKLKVRKPVNIDPATGKRRYRKRNSLAFTMHRKKSVEPSTEMAVFQPLRQSPAPEYEEVKEVVSLTWRPIDDFRLLVNTLQTNDLKQVHMGVKFSCRYTLQEIRERWYNLMYNEKISKVALTACRNLHSKVKRRIYAKALFSVAELKKLEAIPSNSNPPLSKFEELIRENALIFHEARNPKDLQRCWMELKEIHLLQDQDVRKHFERGSEDFTDYEASVQDEDVRNLSIDPAVMHEVLHEERRNKKRIRILEQEIAAWQSLADLVWEGQIIKAPEFDDNTFALIRGKNVRFAMAAKEITLGRRTRDNWVDADLSEEGNDTKISRRQATIKMRALGDFVILNQGKHPMYIDGQALLRGEVAYLHDHSVIRVSKLNFVFIINEKLLNDLRKKIIEEESNAEHIEVADTTPSPAPVVPMSPGRSTPLAKGRTKASSPLPEGATTTTKTKAGKSTSAKSRKSVIVVPPHLNSPVKTGENTDGKSTSKTPAAEKPPPKKRAPPKKPKTPAAPKGPAVTATISAGPMSTSIGIGPTSTNTTTGSMSNNIITSTFSPGIAPSVTIGGSISQSVLATMPIPSGTSQQNVRAPVTYMSSNFLQASPSLSGPSLTGPALSVSSLTGPSLSVSSLTGPSLSVSSLTGPSLSVSSLTGPSLSLSSLTGPSLPGASLRSPMISTLPGSLVRPPSTKVPTVVVQRPQIPITTPVRPATVRISSTNPTTVVTSGGRPPLQLPSTSLPSTTILPQVKTSALSSNSGPEAASLNSPTHLTTPIIYTPTAQHHQPSVSLPLPVPVTVHPTSVVVASTASPASVTAPQATVTTGPPLPQSTTSST